MKPQKSLLDVLDEIPQVACILVALAILMASTKYAQADTVQSDAAAELARLPEATQPVTLSGSCDRGVAVFSVHNSSARWASRGLVQIVDVTSGQVLRERSLIMGQGQTASFRVALNAWDNSQYRPQYRLRVTMPDRGVIYVKSFGGACPASVVSGR